MLIAGGKNISETIINLGKGDKRKDKILSVLEQVVNSKEKAAILHVLIETISRKKLGLYDSVNYVQILESIIEMGRENTHFMIWVAFESCKKSLTQMEEDGSLKIGRHNEEIEMVSVVKGGKVAEVMGDFVSN